MRVGYLRETTGLRTSRSLKGCSSRGGRRGPKSVFTNGYQRGYEVVRERSWSDSDDEGLNVFGVEDTIWEIRVL